jgi:hypothetical protein
MTNKTPKQYKIRKQKYTTLSKSMLFLNSHLILTNLVVTYGYSLTQRRWITYVMEIIFRLNFSATYRINMRNLANEVNALAISIID